jgi:predicted enzyme related to lactoylglutathione lyase
VLGWTAGEASEQFGGYFMFFADGAPAAGCMPVMDGTPAFDDWTIYLTVADAAATVQQVTAENGAVKVPPMQVADLGTEAVLDDPFGARFGIWQADTFPGFGPVGTGKPGTPAWFELHARDYAGAVSFYKKAVGWTPKVMSDVPGFRLTAIEDPAKGQAGQPVAGIMDATGYLRENEAPRWDIYVSVENTDKALETAAGLGGVVFSEATDTPFGRMGGVLDPMGARFKLVSPPA